MSNIHIFESNVYLLIHLIEREYGEDWYESDVNIDIPYLISKHKGLNPPLDSRNFTNILLIFDYERQDLYFSQESIHHLQDHFNRYSDDGTLYVSYPMIESYQHFVTIPDPDYLTRKYIVADLKEGQYKKIVRNHSAVLEYIRFYQRAQDSLSHLLPDLDVTARDDILYKILVFWNQATIKGDIATLLSDYVASCDSTRFVNNLYYAMVKLGYLNSSDNYWTALRGIFIYIAKQSIYKGYEIQQDTVLPLSTDDLAIRYNLLDFIKILEEQNHVSSDPSGFIWVLCTCFTFLGEYKCFWHYVNDESWV